MRRGDEFVSQQKDREAIAAYRAALEVDPLDGRARVKLAQAFYRTEQWAAAAVEGIRAADLLPGDRATALFGVSMLLSNSRFSEAAERSSALLRTNPSDVDALVLNANAIARLLNSTWAIFKVDEAIRTHQDLDRARRELRPPTSASEDNDAERVLRRALDVSPDHLDARFALVNLRWATGRMAEEESRLRRIADELPAHHLANRALALLYLSVRRGADAEKYLRSALSHGDRDSGFILADLYVDTGRDLAALELLDEAGDDAGAVNAARAAEIELRLGRREAATQRVDAILSRLPRQSHALRLKAELLLASANVAGALAAARAAVGADVRSKEARVVLARALEASGDASTAFAELLEAYQLGRDQAGLLTFLARIALAAGRPHRAVEFAEQEIQKNPDNQEARLFLAQGLFRLGDAGRASEVLRPLLARASPSADVWVLEGSLQAARGRAAAASAAYERAQQLQPGSADALSGLVMLDLDAGATPSARRRVEQALSVQSRHPVYWRLAGQVALAAGDVPVAEEAFRNVLGINPADPGAALHLSRILANRQRTDEGIAVLTAALERSSSNAEVRVALARLLESRARVPEARAHYEAVLTVKPRDSEASLRLAAIYADHGGNLDIALTLASQAKRDRPTDPEVSDVLGWVYFRRGLPTLALPHFRDAVRTEASNGTFAYHLGLTLVQLKQSQAGRETLIRAMALSPGAPWIDDARRVLAGG
jgi:tetratricopeptide (TPR) repeat protein